ncbi:chemotaxis protein CheW [Psychrobium sp. 1_MG-2023]|uniref:chemotaxis protein CheW n=1 Tax=Psychrobium sp. 1_MG-2023 TaxID=3062624 RepID=UPI000C345416|nr:chemotaxis protein CheW [Psychrobium sp. 1_MG-2023]MDP2559813.1 chemotaxis protein CheW [Psychrobium sp. 1_MG-2023]PKF59081.1 chemotaxis protein CheW [Alteromonadales bacterium alter-6D02]
MDNRSTKAVADYFSTLLDEKPEDTAVQTQPLERLLAKVSEAAPQVEVDKDLIDLQILDEVSPVIEEEPEAKSQQNTATVVKVESEVEVELAVEVKQHLENVLEQELDERFPVLYFTVGEYMFSVPLIKLKGIHILKKTNQLFGKPNWFKGIQIERGHNINVIDTALYLLPEKDQSQLEQSTDYKYIIVLGDSNWGLACDSLVDSSELTHDEIKWRPELSRCPWLAGTVKERMCGLLSVDALIELFEQNESI